MWDLSSPAKAGTHIPCIGRQIFNHWTTRKVPKPIWFLGNFLPRWLGTRVCNSQDRTSYAAGQPCKVNDLTHESWLSLVLNIHGGSPVDSAPYCPYTRTQLIEWRVRREERSGRSHADKWMYSLESLLPLTLIGWKQSHAAPPPQPHPKTRGQEAARKRNIWAACAALESAESSDWYLGLAFPRVPLKPPSPPGSISPWT